MNGPNDLVILSDGQIVVSNCGGDSLVRLPSKPEDKAKRIKLETDPAPCVAGIAKAFKERQYTRSTDVRVIDK